MKYLLLLCLSCTYHVGECEAPTESKSYQAATMGMIRAFYGTTSPIPGVRWEKRPCLGKGDPCIAAYYTPGCNVIVIGDGFQLRIAKGLLAHELYHAHLYGQTGDADANHQNPGFRPGGIVEEVSLFIGGTQ